MAYLALFVALGGTTYAAATIGAGDIENDAVRSRHLRNGQVFPRDLSPVARTRKAYLRTTKSAKRKVVTLGNLEVTADCVRSPGTKLTLRVRNLSNRETAEMRAGYHHREGNAHDSRTDFAHIAPGSEATVDSDDVSGSPIADAGNASPTVEKAEGQLVLAVPSQVVTFVFHAEIVSGPGGLCELFGNAVAATK